jgi:hypothetical protein
MLTVINGHRLVLTVIDGRLTVSALTAGWRDAAAGRGGSGA